MGVTDYTWSLILPFGDQISCSRCPWIIAIPSASHPDVGFDYGFNHTIPKAIADHKLPKSTYRLGQVFLAWSTGQGINYIYTVVDANNYTYRLKMNMYGSDEGRLDNLSYELEPK